MNRFFRLFRRKSIVYVAIAWALIAIVPASHAADSATRSDKHARKIEKRLAKYRTGAYLRVDLRDNTEVLGSLGQLSDTTFLLTSADNNRKMTISYADVAQVKKGEEYIGEGSESARHIPHLVPILVTAVAAGAAVALVETRPF
jgi:hypothetical protein